MKQLDRGAVRVLEGVPGKLRELRQDNDALLTKIHGALAANDWDTYEVACVMFVAQVDVVIKALDDAHATLDRAWASAV